MRDALLTFVAFIDTMVGVMALVGFSTLSIGQRDGNGVTVRIEHLIGLAVTAALMWANAILAIALLQVLRHA